MSEMVERVARAIRHSQPFLQLTDEQLQLAARAAIAAMREPTKEMTKLFDEADRLWCGDYPVNSTIAEMAWEMMVDAALKQKDPTAD